MQDENLTMLKKEFVLFAKKEKVKIFIHMKPHRGECSVAFEKIASDVYRLAVPFPGCWTGVGLITGDENILVDTGGCAETVDSSIVPALK